MMEEMFNILVKTLVVAESYIRPGKWVQLKPEIFFKHIRFLWLSNRM